MKKIQLILQKIEAIQHEEEPCLGTVRLGNTRAHNLLPGCVCLRTKGEGLQGRLLMEFFNYGATFNLIDTVSRLRWQGVGSSRPMATVAQAG